MRANKQYRFLAQFTEHETFEIELNARSEAHAVALAGDLLRASGTAAFTSVERDVTDWIACSLEAHQAMMPAAIPNVVASPVGVEQRASEKFQHESAPLTAVERCVIVSLLNELRNITLHRSTLVNVDRMLAAFSHERVSNNA